MGRSTAQSVITPDIRLSGGVSPLVGDARPLVLQPGLDALFIPLVPETPKLEEEEASSDQTPSKCETPVPPEPPDPDDARQALIQKFMHAFAPSLGLDADNIRVHLDASSRSKVRGANTSGLAEKRSIFLDDEGFDPASRKGYYLLGHELAHVAQQSQGLLHSDPDPLITRLAEKEAQAIGHAAADKTLPKRPRLRISPDLAMADTTLEEDVQTRYRREIDLIKNRLAGWLGFLWVTDGMMEDVLQVLQSFPFVVAQALIRALEPDERETLIDEIDESHFRRFREQILAAYSVMEESILSDKDEHIFDGMDFRGLSDDEALAVRHVMQCLLQTARDALNSDADRAESISQVMALDQEWIDRQDRRVARERTRPQEEIQSRSARSRRLDRSIRGTVRDQEALDPDFLADLQTIEDMISWRMSDEETLDVLDTAGEYLDRPELLRTLAEYLDDQDLLDRLVHEIPVSDLFEDQATGQRRSRTLVRLLSVRPAYLNVDIAENLLSCGLFDWAVTDEDAFLAFQLIRAVPDSVRGNFEADLAENDQTLYGEMSQSMRESATTHFYDGGPHRADTASIQAQLMQEDIWTMENITRLEGLIRMAIAAGEGHWVFQQSILAAERDPETYNKPDFRNRIVTPFRLYLSLGRNARGELEERQEYDPQDIEGTHWYEEGPFSFLNMIVQGVQTLASSRDVALSGHSIGGEDLDISELQDALGGNLMGIRFSRTGEQRGQDAGSGTSVNMIDHARWDQSRGILEARASSLAIEAVRYPVGGITFQIQRGTIEGFEVHIVAGHDVPTALMVSINTLHLEDLLVITRESMFGVNEINVRTLDVRMGQDGIRNQMTAPREGGRGWGIPIIGLPLRSFINLLILSGSTERLKSGLTEPPSETPVSISIGSINVSGITTSSGQYIDTMHLSDFSVHMASTAQGMSRILEGHRTRLAQLQQEMARAESDEREIFRQRIGQTERQIHTLERYAQSLAEARTEADQLTRRAEQNPEDMTDADRQRLAFLREMLDQAVHGGIVLNAGELTASGLTGSISGERLIIRDIRGSGQSTEGILNMLVESNALQRMVAGPTHQEPVLRSRRHLGPGAFSLEIGSADVQELVVRSSLPDVDDLEEALRLVRRRISRRRTDLSLRDEEDRLEGLIQDVRSYTSLTEIGVSEMNIEQLDQFRELRDRIFSQESFYVHHLTASGISAQAEQRSGGVSLFAGQVDAVRQEGGGAGIRAGGATIGEVHGTGVGVRADVEGVLLGSDHPGNREEQRNLRNRVERFGVSGNHLQILDITHGESGITIDEIDLNTFDLTNDAIEDALDIAASDGSISDIRMIRTPRYVMDGLRQELLELRSQSEEEQAQDTGRIAELEEQIGELRQYMELMAEVARLTESEEDTGRRAEAEEIMQAIAQEYHLWEERLTIGGGSIDQASVRITGLGNPLRDGFSLSTAIEQGMTITGTGGEEGQHRMAGSVTATDIGIGTEGRIGSAAAQQLSGTVEIRGDTIHFRDFGIQSVTVSRFTFNTPVGRISSTGRTTFNRIALDGTIRTAQGDRAVNIRSLRIGVVESEHLRYQNGDLDITLREPPWAAGDEPELREGEQEETRPPLRINGIRVDNLEWSQQTGTMPTRGAIRTGTIHGAVNLLWGDIDMGAEIDANQLDVDFMRGGRAVFLMPEVSGRVRGRAMGAEIDTEFHEISTGPVTYDHNRREIDIPDFYVPWLEVNRLVYSDENMEIGLPENSGSQVTIQDITANLLVVLNPAGSDRAINRIVIRNFYMDALGAWGIDVLLKNINVAGTPRDISLSVPVEEQVMLMGLFLEGNEEDGQGFVIEPPQSDEDRWHAFGSIGLESADVSLLQTCISDLLTAQAGIHARALTVNLFSVGDYEIDLRNLDLDRIRLDAGDHHIVMDESEHGSQYTSDDAGLSIQGFRRERNGVISADNISARGLVYYNEALGIRVDISSFSLPEGARWDTLLPRFVSDRVIQLPRIIINEAQISIDDIMALIGMAGGGGGSGPSIPWEENYRIFDSIDGNISFNASLDTPYVNIPDVPINLDITMGVINYRNLEDQLGVYDAVIDFRYHMGRLTLVVTNRNINDFAEAINGIPPFPTPPPPPDVDAEIIVWQGMDAYERQYAAQGEVLISTLVGRYHSMPLITALIARGGGGGSSVEDFVQIQNINASLDLVGTHIMNLGPYGHLQLGMNGDAVNGLTVTGGVPGTINIGLTQASVSIPEGQPLTLGSVNVEQGSLTIDGLRETDTTLNFTGFLPGCLEGTINGARAENLVLSITPAREGGGESGEHSED